jgi:hypothetical protein
MNESPAPEQATGRDFLTSNLHRVWPWLIDLWIMLVLFLFFLIRILGSNTAKHILNLLGPGRTG